MGVFAACWAAAFCALGAEGGLLIGRPFRHTPQAWLGMLLGMFPRMAIPIGLGLAIQLRGGPLAEAGLLVYLVVFYPVTLAVETAMSLPGGLPRERPGPGSNGSVT